MIFIRIQKFKETAKGTRHWSLTRWLEMVARNFGRFFTSDLATQGSSAYRVVGQKKAITFDKSLMEQDNEVIFKDTPEGTTEQAAIFITLADTSKEP